MGIIALTTKALVDGTPFTNNDNTIVVVRINKLKQTCLFMMNVPILQCPIEYKYPIVQSMSNEMFKPVLIG